jgi:hypothetical protein
MKSRFTFITLLSLILALAFASMPAPAYAAHTITSVTPSQIFNDADRIITITGTDFDSTAEVSLGGTISLLRLTQSPTVLTALVPAGTPAGSYSVTVTMGADVETCASPCLTISNQPPTITPTTAPLPFVRPQFVVRTSNVDGAVRTNSEFRLSVVVENAGFATAYSTQAVFSSADLVPSRTGGVAVLGTVPYDDEVDIRQDFIVTAQITGQKIIVVDLTLTYYDAQGITYTDKFSLSISASGGVTSGGSGAPARTPTPTSVRSSQLVITRYDTDVDPLQPGEHFRLTLDVQNVGNARANRVTMIVGGGSGGSNPGGTPGPGGVSGGSGEFTNFAPVGASNVQSLGDLEAGGSVQASQNLIVNVSTNPGAYPMKITFSYLNDKNEVINDEQVITLLVYSLPNVDISFYRPLDALFAGQPGALPIQVVNLGKRAAVLGNMKVSASNGFVENGTSLIGSLEAGGYFTLDSVLIPDQSGPLELTFTIDYTDDFNQPRTLTRTLEIEVMEGFAGTPIDPSNGGNGGEGFPLPSEENVWQKIWRFILGLLGLDSSAPTNNNPEGVPQIEEPINPRPMPGGGKG